MKLSLWLPYPKNTIAQYFGEDVSDYYAKRGLKGHPAVDYGEPHGETYGEPILNTLEKCYVYSTLNRDNPDLGRYRAVCTMWDDPDSNISYEVIYGHCSEIYAQVGSTPQVGDKLALVGNTGDVYSNGMYVTTAQKIAGSKAGAHLHYQVRKCRRVNSVDPSEQYVSDGNGIFVKNGTYYEVVDYGNGFNGCVDPFDFFNGFLAKDAPEVLGLHRSLLAFLKELVEALKGTKQK